MEKKDRFYWYDKNIIITKENAKEFFFDVDCSYKQMEMKYADFISLNIPEETLVSWRTEYFQNKYDNYNQINTDEVFIIIDKVALDFYDSLEPLVVIKNYETYLNIIKTDWITNRNPNYWINPLFHAYIPKPYFGGFISSFYIFEEYDKMIEAIDLLIELTIKYKEELDVTTYNTKHIYKGLLAFNKEYNLKLDSKLESFRKKLI